jgi:DNA-binding HxlR family transcriptional regulator
MSRNCPVFLTLQLVAHKWSVRILRILLRTPGNTLRFGQLRKQLDGITQRELTRHLREFEKAGIVERTVYPEVPPRVEYRLTKAGHSLLKPIEEISVWAEKNAAFVQRKRQEFEARSSGKERRRAAQLSG